MSEADTPCPNRQLPDEPKLDLSDGITFLIITTPVPPMPLVILRESMGDNHFTNSYDLMQTVMRQSHLKSKDMTTAELDNIKRMKLEVYDRMWTAIKNLSTGSASPLDPPCDWSISAIQEAYSIFQRYLREMVQIYTASSSTPDLRFMPLDYLSPSDPIVNKTRDHLMALTKVWDAVDQGFTHPDVPGYKGTMIYDRESLNYLPYYQLIGMYAHKIRLAED